MKTTEEDSGRCKRCEALEKAARRYMQRRGHSDGCARLMRSNGSNQCVCGHNPLAALLQEV